MTPIDVRPQTQLSLARTFNLCLKGIRHRLFRSLLTTTVVVLAVAFFMVLLADSVIARSVGSGVRAELRELRRPAANLDLWYGKPSPAILARRLADPEAPLPAYAGIAGWSASRLETLAVACRREHGLLAWIEEQDAGTRSILLGVEHADEAFARLADAEGWRHFAIESAAMRSLHLPMPLDEIRACAIAAPATAAACAELARDWHASIDRLAAALVAAGAGDGPAAWTAWIAEADGARLEVVAALLDRHGFGSLHPLQVIAGLQPGLRLESRRDAVVARLKSDDGRAAWLKAFASQGGIDEKLLRIADKRADAVLQGTATSEERAAIADSVVRERDLVAKEGRLAGKVGEAGALVSLRQGFLIAISLVVCMVGIANAMLMSITERFREIATMKCLGATDGYILTQFLMEAGIQGAAGGAIGTAIGALFSLFTGAWLYGSHLVWHLPILALLVAGIVSVIIGLLLATLASIYPSWLASRMAPMEAMRVE